MACLIPYIHLYQVLQPKTYCHKTEATYNFARQQYCFFKLYGNITLTEVVYSFSINYDSSLSDPAVRVASVFPASQFRAVIMLLWIVGNCSAAMGQPRIA